MLASEPSHQHVGMRSRPVERSSLLARQRHGAMERRSFWTDAAIVILLTIPIYGTFYPLETYLVAGADESIGSGGKLPYTPVMLVLISLASAALYFRTRKTQQIQHEVFAYAFVLFAFASCGWSGMFMPTFQRSLRLLPAVALGVIFAQTYSLRRMMHLMTVAFVISAVICAAMALGYPSLGLSKLGNGYENAWRGAMVQKNFTGFTFALGIVVAGYSFLLGAISGRLACLAIPLCTLVMVMSDSATSILALLGTLVVAIWMYLVQRMPFRIRPVFLFVSVLGLAGAFVIGAMLIDTFVGAAGRDMTLTGRTVIWAAVRTQIAESPLFGTGYGIWTSANPIRDRLWNMIGDTAAHSHNSWLDIWLQLGLLGLGTVIIAITFTLGRALWLLLTTNGREVQFFVALFVLLMIRSVTEVEFTDPSIKGLFWLVWIMTSLRILKRSSGVGMKFERSLS